jgi:hypothetical protein
MQTVYRFIFSTYLFLVAYYTVAYLLILSVDGKVSFSSEWGIMSLLVYSDKVDVNLNSVTSKISFDLDRHTYI